MRNLPAEMIGADRSWSVCFDLGARAGSDLHDPSRDIEVRHEDLFWWRMPVSSRLSRAVRGSDVARIGSRTLADPLTLLELIATHALIARTLSYQMTEPAYWVRRTREDGSERFFRPALPETHLSDLLEAPTRQISAAILPLIRDGAVELVRSPSGVRAILMRDGFVDEGRHRARLRA